MRPHRLAISLALALFSFIVGISATGRPSEAAGPQQVCRRVALSKRPGWVSSGAWTADGELLLADARRKSILRFSQNGRSLGSIPDGIGNALANFFPQIIRSTDQGKLMIEVLNGGLITLNKRYIPEGKSDIHAKGTNLNASRRLEGMYLWEPLGKDLITYSDIQEPGENNWTSGFVRVPLDRPEGFSVLRLMDYDGPTHVFYQLGHPYITSLGSTAYVLSMKNPMTILRTVNLGTTKEGLETLPAFPSDKLNLSPQLPPIQSSEDLPQLMRTVESSTIPTGLYGFDNYLFLLWRRPEGARTHWFLTKIDPTPSREQVQGTISLGATFAHHLSVVPGPTNWAFIEKGPVQGWGVQRIDSILLVPSVRLRGVFRDGSDLCN